MPVLYNNFLLDLTDFKQPFPSFFEPQFALNRAVFLRSLTDGYLAVTTLKIMSNLVVILGKCAEFYGICQPYPIAQSTF